MAKMLVHATHGPQNPTRLPWRCWSRKPLSMKGTRFRCSSPAMPLIWLGMKLSLEHDRMVNY